MFLELLSQKSKHLTKNKNSWFFLYLHLDGSYSCSYITRNNPKLSRWLDCWADFSAPSSHFNRNSCASIRTILLTIKQQQSELDDDWPINFFKLSAVLCTLCPRHRLNRTWAIASHNTNRRWFSALAATFFVNYLQSRCFLLSELLTSILTAFQGVVTHMRVSVTHTLSSCDLLGEELLWVMSSARNSLFHSQRVPPGEPLRLIAWLAPLNVTVSWWRDPFFMMFG